MIDRGAILASLLTKNALRREAGLPEWPVRETYRAEIESASWHDFVRENGLRVRAEVLAGQRVRHGADWPMSGGGRMAFSCLVAKTLREQFERHRTSG